MEYTIIEKLPTAAEYNYLRERVGWALNEKTSIDKSLPNSLFCLTVYKNDQIIGMGRIIGDGGLCFYIQDVVVIPEFQKNGIGKQIMKNIMQYIKNNATNDSVIGLMSASGKETFYEKFGFTKRPKDKLGCGMTMCYKK